MTLLLKAFRRSHLRFPRLPGSISYFSTAGENRNKNRNDDDGNLRSPPFLSQLNSFITKYKWLEKENLLNPNLNFISKLFICFELSDPDLEEFDLQEFLNGAIDAYKNVYTMMHSTDFINYASGHISESESATVLRNVLSPRCYNVFKLTMQEYEKLGYRHKILDMTVEGAYISGIKCSTFANKAHRDIIHTGKGYQDVLDDQDYKTKVVNIIKEEMQSPEVHFGDDYAEKWLELDVTYYAEEKHLITTPETELNDVRRNNSTWRFLGCLQGPEHLAWKIVGIR